MDKEDVVWTIARQAPLSLGLSRQEYWSGLSFPSPRDLPNPGIKPGSPALQADTLCSEPPGKPCVYIYIYTMEYYSTSKQNETMPIAATWMDLSYHTGRNN